MNCFLRATGFALPLLSFAAPFAAASAQEPLTKLAPPDFGPNVILLDPSMPVDRINAILQRIEKESGPWSRKRTAIYLLPGIYGNPAARVSQVNATNYINSVVGPMTSIQGLGAAPGDVVVNGNLRIVGNLGTFWRSLQNMRINPVDPESPAALRWIVSEASPLRRLDVVGDLDLGIGHIAFGSAIGNTRISGVVNSGNGRATGVPGAGGQAHYYVQDSDLMGGWIGQSINFVFSGVKGAPPTDFGSRAGVTGPGDKTTLPTTPVSRDAPFLFVDQGRYNVFVPKARFNSRGIAWGMRKQDGEVQPIGKYFVAKPTDSAATINAALVSGKNLLLTPGVYEVDEAIHITRPGTVVLGMGYATLQPAHGTPALRIDDVPGVVVSSLLVDAGLKNSDILVEVGPTGASHGSATNPTTLVDVYVRVGTDISGKATTSMVVNQNDVLINHTWIWRGDVSPGAKGWHTNAGDVGLVVNGDSVTLLGAYIEHYRKQQVVWNGDAGRTIFFQSEPAHDALTQTYRMNGSEKGYAYYEVAPSVRTHEGIGFALYGAASRSTEPIIQTSQIKAPERPGVQFRSVTGVWLFGHGQYSNTFNLDGHAIGKDIVPSFVPGIAATHQVVAWPERQ